jgi:redox-sensitive bicupin YhaK (pirin superfamily)
MMKIINVFNNQATQDGDGVNIARVADFSTLTLDPYLMIDEIKSADEQDYVGGFPEHPHRGIDTFTYMIDGGFSHQDQLGNKETILAGGVQWMSTGSGVMHSEMPVLGENKQIHGFQIWLNIPAADKMRPAIYQDANNQALPVLDNEHGASLKLLAGEWSFADQKAASPLMQLAGDGAIADLTIKASGQASLNLFHFTQVLILIHKGAISVSNTISSEVTAGQLVIVDSRELVQLQASEKGAGMLILAGNKINEEIVHMGPFVMNTQAQMKQTIRDYQAGKFGKIA